MRGDKTGHDRLPIGDRLILPLSRVDNLERRGEDIAHLVLDPIQATHDAAWRQPLARRRWALQALRVKRLDRTLRYQTQESGELFGAARRLD